MIYTLRRYVCRLDSLLLFPGCFWYRCPALNLVSAPVFSPRHKIKADRVEELREGAEVEYLRKVAAVKGESLLGLSDYR